MSIGFDTAIKHLARFADFILPPRCMSCGGKTISHAHLCGTCWSGLEFITNPHCHCCGYPFEFESPTDSLCGVCLKETPIYDWLRSPLVYGDVSKSLILKYKHGRMSEMAPVFTKLIGRVLANLPDDTVSDVPELECKPIFIPVPLHWTRLFQRRFNQSALLAQQLAENFNGEYNPRILKRHKATKSQGGLGRRERARNVVGAFSIDKNIGNQLKNQKIILVDDVYTTGATVSACAKILKKHGAKSVGVVALVRVIKR